MSKTTQLKTKSNSGTAKFSEGQENQTCSSKIQSGPVSAFGRSANMKKIQQLRTKSNSGAEILFKGPKQPRVSKSGLLSALKGRTITTEETKHLNCCIQKLAKTSDHHFRFKCLVCNARFKSSRQEVRRHINRVHKIFKARVSIIPLSYIEA